MQLRPNMLDRRIRLERRTVVTDSSGQPVEHWDLVAEVWARYEPGPGTERFGVQQLVATTDVRFLIRWRRDATPLHRVVFEGREYDVLGVQELGRREALAVTARARAESQVPA